MSEKEQKAAIKRMLDGITDLKDISRIYEFIRYFYYKKAKKPEKTCNFYNYE